MPGCALSTPPAGSRGQLLVSNDGVDAPRQVELEAALGQARAALQTVAGDPELWHELWSLPKRLNKDGRKAAAKDYETFYNSFPRGLPHCRPGAAVPMESASSTTGGGMIRTRSRNSMATRSRCFARNSFTWIDQAGAAIEQSDLAALLHASRDGRGYLVVTANLVITGATAAVGTFGGPPGAAAAAELVRLRLPACSNGELAVRKRATDHDDRIDAFEHTLDENGREQLAARLHTFTTHAELLAGILATNTDANGDPSTTVDELVDELERVCEILARSVESIVFTELLEASVDPKHDGEHNDPARARQIIDALTNDDRTRRFAQQLRRELGRAQRRGPRRPQPVRRAREHRGRLARLPGEPQIGVPDHRLRAAPSLALRRIFPLVSVMPQPEPHRTPPSSRSLTPPVTATPLRSEEPVKSFWRGS